MTGISAQPAHRAYPSPDRVPAWRAQAGRVHADARRDSRLGEAEDTASTVLFLVSDDASHVQGVEIFVDGGTVASPAGAPIDRG